MTGRLGLGAFRIAEWILIRVGRGSCLEKRSWNRKDEAEKWGGAAKKHAAVDVETVSQVNSTYATKSQYAHYSIIDRNLNGVFNRLVVEPLTVHLGDRSYEIRLGSSLTAEIRALADGLRSKERRLALVTDANIKASHEATLRAMMDDAPALILPAGESAKSLTTFSRILDFLAEQRLNRDGALFAVGGGVIGDLGGFAAATFLRGIDCYQIPTTLLAMVDSSVGGKTGINLAAGKNLVGAFHQPRGVFIATDFLRTLPPREFAAGMAEVIKYGLLGDAELFARLEQAPLTPASGDLPSMIRRCCAIKARIVEADERERASEGGRALLNLGHTFGHALEQATGYGRYLHGEAVAVGLAAAARLSHQLGLLPADAPARVDAVLQAHALPVRLVEALPAATLLDAMAHDKKARAGRLRFVVLRRLGEAVTQPDVGRSAVEAAWRAVGAV